MEESDLRCAICEAAIAGKPFTLSSLTEPPRVLQVCEACAGSEWVTLDVGGIQVTVFRDDYLVADKERFEHAVDAVLEVLEEHGWDGHALKMRGKSESIREPVDELF